MVRKMLPVMVILGLVLAGAVLVLPAAAAKPVRGGAGNVVNHSQNHAVNSSRLDPALRADLQALHTRERLAQFDLNVQKGHDTIELLNKYNYNTSGLSGTLSHITDTRTALENALAKNDTAGLKTINKGLFDLWKSFGKTLKQLLKT